MDAGNIFLIKLFTCTEIYDCKIRKSSKTCIELCLVDRREQNVHLHVSSVVLIDWNSFL